MSGVTLANHFLIAMPALLDPNFARTVTYLCEHDEHGAMGLVINRPLELTLQDLLTQIDIEATDVGAAPIPVFQGGPVQTERGFVLHQPIGNWDATLQVTDDVGVTMSRDILEAIAQGDAPQRFLVTLGYAGWGAGQLEREMAENAWLSGPADAGVIFDEPVEQRWALSAAHLGIDLSLLSSDIGHA
jgi:putative transcriptional regulator